eukprot:Tamp_10095.p1 GENE.Tamp_10095~~Tamp_10095.p1  ORF type:complete len:550 (+),score=115.24 Tamp_10095:199-1848(+)
MAVTGKRVTKPANYRLLHRAGFGSDEEEGGEILKPSPAAPKTQRGTATDGLHCLLLAAASELSASDKSHGAGRQPKQQASSLPARHSGRAPVDDKAMRDTLHAAPQFPAAAAGRWPETAAYHGPSSATDACRGEGGNGGVALPLRQNEPPDIKERESYVGKSVNKLFRGRGYFRGNVREYDAGRDVYKIVYEDGDMEELSYEEVKSLTRKDGNGKCAGPDSAASNGSGVSGGGGSSPPKWDNPGSDDEDENPLYTLGKAARRVEHEEFGGSFAQGGAAKKFKHDSSADGAAAGAAGQAAARASADKPFTPAPYGASHGTPIGQVVGSQEAQGRNKLRLGGRPAQPTNVGKATFDMLAVELGGARVLLPGSFDDPHVVQALKRGQVLCPLKEGHMRKARAFQQAIDEFTAAGHVRPVAPSPACPADGHILFKAGGERWQELRCQEFYGKVLERTVELHNAECLAKSSRADLRRAMTVSSLKKNLCEFGIEQNEKMGILRFQREQWNLRSYRLGAQGVSDKGSSPNINIVLVDRLPQFYCDFGSKPVYNTL